MCALDLESLVDQLLPQVLADPDLGDGQVFTCLHFNHLWALSCLQVGEWYDEELLATCVADHLPPQVRLAWEAATHGRLVRTMTARTLSLSNRFGMANVMFGHHRGLTRMGTSSR
jgi:hypothetical protein